VLKHGIPGRAGRLTASSCTPPLLRHSATALRWRPGAPLAPEATVNSTVIATVIDAAHSVGSSWHQPLGLR
jgi:hypothetical protein